MEPTDAHLQHILIEGHVQGVGFRAWVVEEALYRGLGGWVRNRHGGAVEAVFLGPQAAVLEMVDACRCGPTACRVDAVHMVAESSCSAEEALAGFEIRDTA